MDAERHNLGDTSLDVACMGATQTQGADMFTLSEGYPSLATARLLYHNNICDLPAALIKEAQARDLRV